MSTSAPVKSLAELTETECLHLLFCIKAGLPIEYRYVNWPPSSGWRAGARAVITMEEMLSGHNDEDAHKWFMRVKPNA